jgi:acetate kinase
MRNHHQFPRTSVDGTRTSVLVFNAGSASLKFEVVSLDPADHRLDTSSIQLSAAIEGIGSNAVLSVLKGKDVVHQERIVASDYAEATRRSLEWLDSARHGLARTADLDIVGHRVVHGARRFNGPVQINDDVMAGIESLEDLAPLHNEPAVRIIRAARAALNSKIAMVAVFDTTFHQDIPAQAAAYALPYEVASRHSIRRYGFHGISHQYMTRRYAQLTGKDVDAVNIVTLHLESGCSAAAIRAGKSVDTSMGFTPLEGLVMGTRCGDIDPAIVGYLARKEQVGVNEVEEWLNKKSGLLGISGRSHDTRPLMQHFSTDERSRLAMEVFCYRARKYVGAYIAALDGAEAIVFGGGIGEDTPFVRKRICEGFRWCGLKLDQQVNEGFINREGRISAEDSRLHAYVIPVEEGLMIAHEAVRCVRPVKK